MNPISSSLSMVPRIHTQRLYAKPCNTLRLSLTFQFNPRIKPEVIMGCRADIFVINGQSIEVFYTKYNADDLVKITTYTIECDAYPFSRYEKVERPMADAYAEGAVIIDP